MSQGASNAIMATSAATGLLNTAISTSETTAINTIVQSAVYEVIGGNAQGLRIRGVVNFTGGASTTAVVVKLRQGSSTTSGTQVGPSQTHTLAASAAANVAFDFIDASPSSQAEGYCLTLTASGAAGTLNSATIGVEVADQVETGLI